MKKRLVLIIIAWILLSGLLFLVFSHSLIVSPLNQCNENLKTLKADEKIYEEDFEQVYLHDDYNIYPKNDLIIVELKEGSCKLILHYTHSKEFVASEISAPLAWTETGVLIMLWMLTVVLSVSLAIGIILIPIWIANSLKEARYFYRANGRH